MEKISRSVIDRSPESSDVLSDIHRYETDKGQISLLTPCKETNGSFEINSTKKNLFLGTEKYSSLDQAEKRINELLL